jgi:integrase/recombinase XerD
MLENRYVRPITIDRIRGSWIAPAIERRIWLRNFSGIPRSHRLEGRQNPA